MATNFQFKSSLIDYTYEGQGYSYTITPNNWTTIDVDKIIFGQFISLISDVYAGGILVLNRQKLFDKFELTLSASNGGSGTGGSLEPAGDWDIAASTTSGGIIETPLILSVLTDALSNETNVIYEAGLNTVPYSGPYYFYGGSTTNTVTTDFSTTKWLTFGFTGYNFSVLYDSTGIPAETALADFIVPLINAVDSAVPSVEFSVVDYGGGRAVAVQYRDILTQGLVQVVQVSSQTVPDLLTSTTVSFGMNLALGKIYIETDNIAVQEFDIPTDVLSTANELTFFAGGVYGASFSPASLVLTFPDQQNKPPITQLSEEITVVPPMGANDGELWNVTSTGTYNGKDLKNNDSVIFYNGLEEIVAITHPDTSAIVNDAISTALAENGQISVAIDRILAAKGFNSYGGTWNFGGQYDGTLNFSYYFSANYSNNFFQATGGNYIESGGLYYSVVRDATADLTNEVTFDLILPNISNNNNHKLVVDIRDSGSFNDTSIADKFATFTFVNLDDTGLDNSRIELSVTHSIGSGETFTFPSVDLCSVGEKIHFVLTTTGVYAMRSGSTFLGAYSTNFSNNTAAVYVGYGKDSNSFYQPSFVLTQGSKDVILPPLLERKNVTYKATNTDGYSEVYGKTIKDDDLVTFIGTGPSEDVLVENVADLSLPATYSPHPTVYIADGETAPLTVKIIAVESSDLVMRNINVYNTVLIDYSLGTIPTTGLVMIDFNVIDSITNVDVGRNYRVGDGFHIKFNTVGGSSIQDVIFNHAPSGLGGNIIDNAVTIAADKITTYSFMVMRDTNNTYNTRIVCIGKMEI